MKKSFLILNYVAFQICWFSLLVFENFGLIIFFIFLMLHFVLIYYIDGLKHLKLEVIAISVVSLLGIALDLILSSYNILKFKNQLSYQLPLWYIAFWPLLAATLNHCFYLFHRFNTLLLGIIGAVSVPVIYSGAERVSSSFSLGMPKELSLLAIGSAWFFMLPFIIKLTILLKNVVLDLNSPDTNSSTY